MGGECIRSIHARSRGEKAAELSIMMTVRRFRFSRRRYGHAFGREVVGVYHTRSGKNGATISRYTGADGRVTYSYTGEWGAGSGLDLATIQNDVAYWRLRKRGMRVIQEFRP